MALGDRITLAVRAGGLGEEDLHVLAVEGREALSEPFLFDVEVRPAGGDALDPASFLREEAVLSLRRPAGAERFVHGECVRLALLRVEAGKPVYLLRVAPKLLRLAQVVRSRIFQDQSALDVVKAILDAHGVDHQESLSGSFPKRTYVTQYAESDLAFVARLLAEEGVWWRFDHAEGGHTLVLGDAPSALASGAPAVPQRLGAEGGEAAAEHVARLEALHALASGKATERDYDPEKPAVDLTASKGKGDLEVYAYPGGYVQPAEGKRVAGLRLDRLALRGAGFAGTGNALAFLPGAKVEVEDGPTLAVVRVVHRARQQREAGAGGAGKGTAYENAFEAVDASVPWRPPLLPRPRLGVQTATVTGPQGEEIHVDRLGRIKIQLHWDREGKRDEKSSCWVRVAQPWAGQAWGALRLPRVGQEVVVRWLEGDPDRPLVTGAVYDGANAPPVALPDQKTRSVQRTDTSPGGGGSNELTLDDTADEEEVFLHAQKDWNGTVEHDRTEGVGHDADLVVGGDRARTVKGSQAHRVTLTDTGEVKGAVSVTVGRTRTDQVGAEDSLKVLLARAVTVAGVRSVAVGAVSAETVGAAAALTVGGVYQTTVGAFLNHTVARDASTQIAGAAVEVVGLARVEAIQKNLERKVSGDEVAAVGGQVAQSTAKDAEETVDEAAVEAKERLTFKCKEGKLEADKVTIIVGGNVALALSGGNTTFAGKAVTVSASGNLTLKGSKAALGGSGSAEGGSATVEALKDLDPAKKTVKVALRDARGKPALAGVKFKLKTPGGDKSGTVDGSGVISVGDLQPGSCSLELDLD